MLREIQVRAAGEKAFSIDRGAGVKQAVGNLHVCERRLRARGSRFLPSLKQMVQPVGARRRVSRASCRSLTAVAGQTAPMQRIWTILHYRRRRRLKFSLLFGGHPEQRKSLEFLMQEPRMKNTRGHLTRRMP